jgi:hypothetical protein
MNHAIVATLDVDGLIANETAAVKKAVPHKVAAPLARPASAR